MQHLCMIRIRIFREVKEMETKQLWYVNSALFGLMAVLHLLRLLLQWPASIARWSVPMWLSAVALVAAGLLSYGNYKAK